MCEKISGLIGIVVLMYLCVFDCSAVCMGCVCVTVYTRRPVCVFDRIIVTVLYPYVWSRHLISERSVIRSMFDWIFLF